MNEKDGFLSPLNIKAECEKYELSLFECPQFLFILMGSVIIASIIATYFVAKKYADIELAALIALAITAFLFIIGFFITRAFEKLAEASKMKSEFISIVSHHLREPVSAIKWGLELLEKEETNEEEKRSIYGRLKSQNQKLLRALNDLNEANNVQNKKTRFERKPFSLEKLTQVVLNDFSSQTEAANLSLNFKFSPDLPPAIGDYKKTQMVIEHLLNNAVTYNQPGGNIDITAEKSGNRVLWRIEDQGVGIPENELSKISGKFFRSKNAYRYQKPGLGLGLYLSKELIGLQNGKFGFHSTEGKGSSFWFTLPTAL